MEREPEALPDDDDDRDLFGEPDDVDDSIEEQLDEHLREERERE